MIKVKKGQDPYSVIGQYIRDHVSAIEDMIAVIEIDGVETSELFMVDMTVDGYFIWKSDWYEGGENVVLIDFFPVSDACNPKDRWIPCSERLPKVGQNVMFSVAGMYASEGCLKENGDWAQFRWNSTQSKNVVDAWAPMPEPYKGGQE